MAERPFFMREEMIEKQARLFQKIQQQYKKTWAGLELYVAKNHWIFDFGEMQPVPAYTEAQKERIYQNLQRLGQYFDEKGVRFYFMVVPPKGEIYPEYNIRFLNKSDGIIDLHQYFQKRAGGSLFTCAKRFWTPRKTIMFFTKQTIIGRITGH